MASLQKSWQKMTAEVPYKILENVIKKKLRGLGAPEELASKLLDNARSGASEKVIWDNGEPDSSDLVITITDDDLNEAARAFEKFVKDGLPQLLEEVSDKAAKDLLASLKQQWPGQSAFEQAVVEEFRENLQIRWGKGLSLLRMLLYICREIGAEIVKRRRRRKKNLHLQDVLFRLHVRACQVSDEIITLLESGFADGAMARWRTLYEISVVATIIADKGEEIAERYVVHQIVDSKNAMDEHARCAVLLGYKPISKREISTITKRHDEALAKYGKEFGSPYGWAAQHLNQKKPTFRDLEAAAGRAAMRSHYKMASYNVHADPKGIFFRQGTLDPSVVIAGASNAGLTDPAQNTAITLTAITALLLGPPWNIDVIVELKTIASLRDDIPNVFYRAEQKLKSDDARYRRKVGGQKR